MSAPNDTRARLLCSARQLGAALAGIEAVTELLTAAAVDRIGAETWLEPMTSARALGLMGAVGALARYARHDLEQVLGAGDPDGEELLLWGGAMHLYPSRMAGTAEGAA
ncbi:hypothetical protein [uncultured Lamprocystis sp.]|jgi:hypothetical protein|uniref:hypothetical protein n=1 Tax=uncultured Lamprocystis sp. TaxID=543132 RepID=UPI0025D77DE6|nr:hypothetical protein [uncultured Lamprocystis sp.]